jgi:hypothetical protein
MGNKIQLFQIQSNLARSSVLLISIPCANNCKSTLIKQIINTHNCRKQHVFSHTFVFKYTSIVGQVSSVGIATRYGQDGQEIKSRWRRVFPLPSRLALRPTQPPIQWVPGISSGVRWPVVALTTHSI